MVSTTAPTPASITEDEAALYDRQIRLWGLDAQNRLRNGSVLLVGMDGLGAEIAKNLMLVGLKSLTLIDDTIANKDEAQFFIACAYNQDKTRAEASLVRCQLLNPLVKLTAVAGPVQDQTDQFFGQFSLVCLVGQPESVVASVNRQCRAVGVQFLAGTVHGWFGAAFFDLGDKHEYLDEKVTEDISEAVVSLDESVEEEGDGSPEQKRIKTEQHHQQTNAKKTVEQFSSYEALRTMEWQTKSTTKLIDKLPAAFFANSVMEIYRKKHGKLPDRPVEGSGDALKSELNEIWEGQLKKCGLKDSKKLKCTFENVYEHLFGQLSPVCAVNGGMIAQEIIKALSHKDAPLNNTFFYSGLHSNGVVLKLPPI